MKKIVFILVAALMLIGMTACGESTPSQMPESGRDVSSPESATTGSSKEDGSASLEAAGSQDTQPEHKTVLVVVFSATGTTKRVAEKIAAIENAELYEIKAAQEYSSADLNWNDSNSRATKEQNDNSVRPEIGSERISLDGYEKIYIGYPIWWGQAPRILSTFVESYDFTGITVIPFCTSGSSDIGQSDDTLAAQAGSGNWLKGRRFSGSVSEHDLQVWINETGGTSMDKTLRLSVSDEEVAVDWENNESVAALTELVSSGPLTIQMSMYGGFEQVGPLGIDLPRNDGRMTTQAGDIVLYAGNQIVIFYGANSWAYTRLGRITDRSAAELVDMLGNGNATVTLSWK